MEWFRVKGGMDGAVPTCVTGTYTVSFKAPTPMAPVTINARVASVEGRKAQVTAEVVSSKTGTVTATSEGVFVRVSAPPPPPPPELAYLLHLDTSLTHTSDCVVLWQLKAGADSEAAKPR